MATFTNQATLTYDDTTVNSNIVTGQLQRALTIRKIAVADSYTPGGTVTYLVSIENRSNTAYTDLTLTDDLGGFEFGTPAVTRYPLAYVEGSLLYFVNGAPQAAPDVDDGPPLVISDFTVPAEGNVLFIYETEVTEFASPELEGYITNEVTLSGDDLSAPIRDTETVNAAIGPDLAIAKSLSPLIVTENGRLIYTLTVLNRGNADADEEEDVVIIDVFDPILSDIAVTLNGATLTEGTDYTYNEATGRFATVEGRVTVPAAEFTRNANGSWSTEPGSAVLTISGTV